VRARNIENSLDDAIQSVPELSLAKRRVSSLEKSLALRSKEISMQNARLSDLEKMLARSNAQPSSRLVTSQASTEEVKSLKQENQYLSEAMDVLNRQVEEYENEIRARDSKTPTKARRSRRSFTPESRSSSQDSLRDGEDGSRSAFEAALFRPALQAARCDAAKWKAKATIQSLLNLSPLKVYVDPIFRDKDKKNIAEEHMDPLFQLSSSLSSYQQETASVHLVDITKSADQTRSPRRQLCDTLVRKATASQEVDKAAAAAQNWLERYECGISKIYMPADSLVGRLKFGGPEPIKTISTQVNLEDLYRIQLDLVKCI